MIRGWVDLTAGGSYQLRQEDVRAWMQGAELKCQTDSIWM